jgi:tape measure domain-containing protein
LGAAVTKGFSRLTSLENAEFKLKALGNTAGDVKKIMASVNDAVKGTACSVPDAAGAAATAVATGIAPGKDLTQYLTGIADAAAFANTSFGEMSSIFTKIAGSNKAYTDDLMQLQDRGIPILQALQKQYGVTGEQLQKMVSDGQVDAATFQRALEQSIGGTAQKMGQTFTGSVDNMNTALARLGAKLINSALGGNGLVCPAGNSLNIFGE